MITTLKVSSFIPNLYIITLVLCACLSRIGLTAHGQIDMTPFWYVLSDVNYPHQGILTIEDNQFDVLVNSDLSLTEGQISKLREIRQWTRELIKFDKLEYNKWLGEASNLVTQAPHSTTARSVGAEILIHPVFASENTIALSEFFLAYAYDFNGSIFAGILLAKRLLETDPAFRMSGVPLPLDKSMVDHLSMYLQPIFLLEHSAENKKLFKTIGLDILNSIVKNHDNDIARYELAMAILKDYDYTNIKFINDDHSGLLLLKKAAEGGIKLALQELLILELEGRIDTDKEITEVIEEMEKLASLGYVTTCLILGKYFYYGLGVEKNLNKSIEYYEKAAYKKNIEATLALNNIYMDMAISSDEIEYYEKALYWHYVTIYIMQLIGKVNGVLYNHFSLFDYPIISKKLDHLTIKVIIERVENFTYITE